MAEKLELKHLAPYLPYELEFKDYEPKDSVFCMVPGNIEYCLKYPVKPILRPLSDLTKEELDLFTVNFRMHRNNTNFNYELMIVKDYELALSLHLDIFNLIPNNLAVDINTLK